MCGIAEPTSDMATILKEKLKEKEEQIKLTTVAKKIDRLLNRLTEAVKHWAERKQISPKIVKAIEHLTTEKQSGAVANRYTPHTASVEKEEMAGILERPTKQQRALNIANN